jgi:hypothetical protein
MNMMSLPLNDTVQLNFPNCSETAKYRLKKWIYFRNLTDELRKKGQDMDQIMEDYKVLTD